MPLPELAEELGVHAVFVKDESSRMGLPAFKILGASWGTFRAIAAKTGLSLDAGLTELAHAAQALKMTLFAATEGNHGRAVARMGNILGVPTVICVPNHMDLETQQKIHNEGARVLVVQGDYDAAVAEASVQSTKVDGGVLVQDNAFDQYEQIPAWIVEGYSTLLQEVEQQLASQKLTATLVVTPIGVGSLGHAVVAHCKSDRRAVTVLTVEPATAACLHQNLKAGQPYSIETSNTIMSGMNCGTVSPISWPILCAGVDASVTISDLECHRAVEYLVRHGVNAGPCGASALAGLWKAAAVDPNALRLSKDSVIVLLSTEGRRNYRLPN